MGHTIPSWCWRLSGSPDIVFLLLTFLGLRATVSEFSIERRTLAWRSNVSPGHQWARAGRQADTRGRRLVTCQPCTLHAPHTISAAQRRHEQSHTDSKDTLVRVKSTTHTGKDRWQTHTTDHRRRSKTEPIRDRSQVKTITEWRAHGRQTQQIA